MRILAIDVGSSAIKAGWWNGQRFELRTRVAFPTHLEGSTAEIDATVLTRAFLRAGRMVLAKAAYPPDAVAFCTFSSGVLVADARHRPLTPIITHADRRSIEAAKMLVKRRPPSWWLAHTGNLPYPGGIGTSSLAWLRKTQTGIFGRGVRIGQVSTYLASLLSGGKCWPIDPSQAVFLGLYDIRRPQHSWCEDAVRLLGLAQESLPKLNAADSVLAGLGASVARAWRLPSGIPIVGGFVDTSAAVIQTPMKPGQLAHSSGSTDVLAMCTDAPSPAAGLLTRPVGVDRSFPNRWLLVDTIAASGSAIQWCRTTLFRELSDARWKRLLEHQCRLPLDGSTDVACELGFVGERAEIEQSSGARLSRLRLSSTREELLRSVLSALIVRRRRGYDRLASVHRPAARVHTMGGASALGDAMHAAWPARHFFRPLPGDGLAGLVLLAERTLKSP